MKLKKRPWGEWHSKYSDSCFSSIEDEVTIIMRAGTSKWILNTGPDGRRVWTMVSADGYIQAISTNGMVDVIKELVDEA
jgi:hypothetical protein